VVAVSAVAVAPRFSWAPPRARSLGPDCVAFWRDAGGELFDWQELVIEAMLGLDEDDQWASTTDGLDVARQNGKGVILQAIEMFCAFELDYPVVMHTAHEFATSQEHQVRLEAMIQNASHLHGRVKDRGGYVHANGQESIRLKSGSRIMFKARTKGGGRGYSGDLLVWDEAMVIPDAVVGAQLPTHRASRSRHGRKTIYAGSAVDQEVHEHGVNFARLRARGLAQAQRVSWHEWSAPFDDPDEIDEDVIRDRELWLSANPSMADGLVTEETMADEIESMPHRIVAVELLGVGDWPDIAARGESPISREAWDALVDSDSQIVGPVAFAYDVSPDRSSSSISVAGHRGDGLSHVEVVESQPGTSWVPARVAELLERHETVGVFCDAAGPAGSLVEPLAQLCVEVATVSAQEHARACGMLFDAVEEATVRHLGTSELRSAIRGAAKRPLGDAWAWSRKSSSVNISPLVACTLALWGSSTVQPAKQKQWRPA
jgi:hypothetical protein